MKLVRVGGRVKSAAVGLDRLFANSDSPGFEKYLSNLRENPPRELLEAFFPSNQGRLKQLMRGVGFYRPVLKTDQGMAGNFIPFYIDSKRKETDLSIRTIVKDELIAVPEMWFPHNAKNVDKIQKAFYGRDFIGVCEMLETLGTRQAEKGRTPFFFIRPAATAQPIVFGQDVVSSVERCVQDAIGKIVNTAAALEKEVSGFSRPANILYCQPDVYILRNGAVALEKINLPDVGLFLGSITHPFAGILSQVQEITRTLEEKICDTIAKSVPSKLAIVTRREVMEHSEDLLEIMEMQRIAAGLAKRGIEAEVVGVNQIGALPRGSHVLLMNLDYSECGLKCALFERHAKGEIVCFPNPFVQMVSRWETGLKVNSITGSHQEKFLRLIEGIPTGEEGEKKIREQLERRLSSSGVRSDILHADLGEETVPILRHSLHSWRQLAKRARRRQSEREIRLMEIAVTPENLLITSDTGPRLHVFRFMFTTT